MVYYIYDGTFEGLLTAIYESYYRPEKPYKILREDSPQENFLVTTIVINTDAEKAMRVYNAIRDKISSRALRQVFYAFLSEDEEAGSRIYHYLRLGWKIGGEIDQYHTNDEVSAIHKMSQKVSKETHRMLGLIRFQKIEGDIYYAIIEPDHHITALVAPHFAKRMADQNWVIHDIQRNVAALYNKGHWIMTEAKLEGNLPLDEEEIHYQDLWQKYFKTIAIKDRINPRLQKAYMPKRYWKHLIELNRRGYL